VTANTRRQHDFSQFDFDLFIIAVAFAGTVVTLMLDRAVRAGGVVIKNEMRVSTLPSSPTRKRRHQGQMPDHR
jgi:hypothetical protein